MSAYLEFEKLEVKNTTSFRSVKFAILGAAANGIPKEIINHICVELICLIKIDYINHPIVKCIAEKKLFHPSSG